MVLNTFIGGVDTNFSTKLNENFTYVDNYFKDRIKSFRQKSAITGRYLSESVIIRLNGTSIERSTDSGSNFSVVQASVPAGGTFNINSNDPNYIVYYAKEYNAQAYYSTNAGVSWATITAPPDADQYVIAYSITDTGRIYSIYSDGGNTEVAYTDNAGTSWTVVTDPGTCPAMASDDIVKISSPKNICILYAYQDTTSTDGYAGYSLDEGVTWTEGVAGGSLNADIVGDFYIDSDNYYIDFILDQSEAGSNGTHILRFNGVTISSSTSDGWSYERTIVDGQRIYRPIYYFSATQLIYSVIRKTLDGGYATGEGVITYNYTTDSVYPLMSPGMPFYAYFRFIGLDDKPVITNNGDVTHTSDSAYYEMNGE